MLVDTPGCDPFDSAQMEELTALAATAAPPWCWSSRPASTLPKPPTRRSAYVASGARLLVATRLDLARRLGGILAAAGSGLALTEAGIGPGAADGLLPITPAWLAARLLTGVPP